MVICVGHTIVGRSNPCSTLVSVPGQEGIRIWYIPVRVVLSGSKSWIEGIQAHEKITLLRKEFLEKGNKAGWKKIEKMLAAFRLTDFPETPAAVTVNRANEILNSL